ncbi:MAG: c-type cytochrome [Nevskiaceae bacterium]|nr:MAG: c-type cytochrome [Nevskiaceae bacterium]
MISRKGRRMRTRKYRVTAAVLGICTLLAAGFAFTQTAPGPGSDAHPATATTLELYPLPVGADEAVQRGRYLAMAGDCAGCHTVDRRKPFAGGVPVETPFGVIYTTNITPDPSHGLGKWSFGQFYTAMHEGIAPGHRYLYPAFPFPGFSKMPKEDVQDLWQYLKTIPAAAQENRENGLRFPYSFRPLMFFWRVLFFRADTYAPDATQTAEWNRGAYLVEGPTHCADCHSPRGFMGQIKSGKSLSGGVVEGWWAPNLTGNQVDGLADWSVEDLVQYLHTGSSPEASTLGPMGVVVEDSLQFLTPADLKAMAVYLKSLDRSSIHTPLPGGGTPVDAAKGRQVYDDNCSSCHLWNGKGYPYAPGIPGISPPLAGNPTVVDTDPRNVTMAVLAGSVEPNTIHRPLPYSMPGLSGFAQALTDDQIAEVVNYIRNSWGNKASGISAEQVKAMRLARGIPEPVPAKPAKQ